MPTATLILLGVLPALAYLLGAIPFGLLIGLARGVDIRKAGSGNIGATNLGRVVGRKYFFYAFFLDALKGFVPVLTASLLARQWNQPQWIPLVPAAAAVVGHICPVYIGFKGGKGVATGLGAVLGIWPVYTLAGLAALAVFVVIVLAYRYVSLGSIVATWAFVGFCCIVGQSKNVLGIPTFMPWPQLWPLVTAGVVFAMLILVKHRANIRRLMAGTEPKVGQKPSLPSRV